MRKYYVTRPDGTPAEGYSHHMSIQVGEFWQSRKTDKWFVVTSVEEMYDPSEGKIWFCQLRDATDTEIAAHLAPKPKSEMDLFDDFFSALEERGN